MLATETKLSRHRPVSRQKAPKPKISPTERARLMRLTIYAMNILSEEKPPLQRRIAKQIVEEFIRNGCY